MDVLLSAGFEGWWAKRSGLGLLVDRMVRMEVWVGLGCAAARSGRVDNGRRNDRGMSPQLRGALGGIVVVGVGIWDVLWESCGLEISWRVVCAQRAISRSREATSTLRSR